MSTQSSGLKKYTSELHIHTVLSPCASIEMIPPMIIAEAETKNINLIAITDHNSIENIQSVMKAAQGSDVTVLPGLELQTREEIHSLCLFDTLSQTDSFYRKIEDTFPKINNDAEFFGEQFIVDERGNFIRREERLLITSSTFSLSDAIETVESHGGLLIPAHVNRTAFGLFPVLGFIPQDINTNIFEISRHISIQTAIEKYPQLKDHKIIQNSDAHSLDEIIGFNEFHLAEPTTKEIRMALMGENDRTYKNLFKK